MATKKEETASFVLRFNQKIFKNAEGEQEVQWRGHIQHVQGGDEKRFSEFGEISNFIQSKLADLTIQAMEDKTPEEQQGILARSFDLWKKMAFEGPKMVIDTLKDPKKQMAQFQNQFNQMGDALGQKIEEKLGQKLELDEWRAASKSDYHNLTEMIGKMSESIEALNKKVEKLGEAVKN